MTFRLVSDSYECSNQSNANVVSLLSYGNTYNVLLTTYDTGVDLSEGWFHFYCNENSITPNLDKYHYMYSDDGCGRPGNTPMPGVSFGRKRIYYGVSIKSTVNMKFTLNTDTFPFLPPGRNTIKVRLDLKGSSFTTTISVDGPPITSENALLFQSSETKKTIDSIKAKINGLPPKIKALQSTIKTLRTKIKGLRSIIKMRMVTTNRLN